MANGPNIVEIRTDPDATRKERNRLNRVRGKRMETMISRLFLGNTRGKVAYSGAGAEKGDNKIPLPNQSGHLYIECKSSAFVNAIYGPGVPLRYDWFDTIERHRRAMGSTFGTLALHFHNHKGYYMLFRVEDIPILESISGNSGYSFNGPHIDNRYTKQGKPRMTDKFYRGKMLEGFKLCAGTVPNIIYWTFAGPWVAVTVEDFKTLCGYPESV